MPSSKTCVCSLRKPRVKTEVSCPAVPVCTTDKPGTSRSASATRSVCFCSKSSAVITLMLAGDSSSGIGILVALTTISWFSGSPGEGVGDASWARPRIGAPINRTTNTDQQGGQFRITSFLHLLRGGLVACAFRPRLSFFFLRRSFFEPSAHAEARMRWNGQIFWLLAYGPNVSDTPSSRLHRVLCTRLAHGKSYPVTAAQLLPIHTGFLAPIH